MNSRASQPSRTCFGRFRCSPSSYGFSFWHSTFILEVLRSGRGGSTWSHHVFGCMSVNAWKNKGLQLRTWISLNSSSNLGKRHSHRRIAHFCRIPIPISSISQPAVEWSTFSAGPRWHLLCSKKKSLWCHPSHGTLRCRALGVSHFTFGGLVLGVLTFNGEGNLM